MGKTRKVTKESLPTGCSIRPKGSSGKYVAFFNKATNGKANKQSQSVCLDLSTDNPTPEPTVSPTPEPTVSPTPEPTASSDPQYVLLAANGMNVCRSSAELLTSIECFTAIKTFGFQIFKTRKVTKESLPTGCSIRPKGSSGKYVAFFNKATNGKANQKSQSVCLDLSTDSPTPEPTVSPTPEPTVNPTPEPTASSDPQYVLLAANGANVCRSSAELLTSTECFAAIKTFGFHIFKTRKVTKESLPTGCSIRPKGSSGKYVAFFNKATNGKA